MVYQPGKANIIADALLWSRPSAAKSEESAQWEQQEDQDAGKQCDQAFIMTNLGRVEESKLMGFKNTQQENPILKELFTLQEVELKHKNFGISPQGIFVKVKDDKQRLVVP